MPADHMDLPAQAMACVISGLEPSDVTRGWNPTDGSLLAEIATNKVLHAVIKVDGLDFFSCCQLYTALQWHSEQFVTGCIRSFSPSFPFLLSFSFPSLSLEVGPLNTAGGLGECCKLP